ncbi:MAG TPA: hypothetical protein VNH41_05710, partial [Steroidobacteraceae bacterium]|nr:hypothetical protein [Steroidobacteraceae bacterium]
RLRHEVHIARRLAGAHRWLRGARLRGQHGFRRSCRPTSARGIARRYRTGGRSFEDRAGPYAPGGGERGAP